MAIASTQLAASSFTACFRLADKASSGSFEAERWLAVPPSKHWDVVRNFVVAGYTEDTVDGEVPWRVRWWISVSNPRRMTLY